MRFRSGTPSGFVTLVSGLALALVIGSVHPAQAISPSGTAVSVVPAAAAAGTTGRRTLQVDGDVFMGDRVQTGPGGEAQIQFKDATKLVVGPNSSMTIDAFVFDESNTARKITMNASKGAFRFITGNSQKQAYTINTPTSTIGIRGTRFDFAVAGSGEMTLALFEGEARICDRAGNCRNVRGGCEVVVTPRGGGVEPAPWPQVAARFPYVQSQDSLLPAFRVNTAGCGSRSGTIRQQRADSSDRTRTAPRERTFDPPDPPDPPDCGEGEGEGGNTTRSFSGQSRSSKAGAQTSSSREGIGGRSRSTRDGGG